MPTIDDLAQRLTEYLTPEQVNCVRRAYYYASQAHDGQRRRSGEKYVTHPLAVARILAEMHMDHQSLMAAMLHDVIEDTGIPKEALAEQFGDAVADLVDGVSKLTQISFDSKEQAQAENFQKMAMAMARDIRVIIVKLADRLHNMRTLEVMSPPKRRRIAKETLEIYAPIANRLGMRDVRVSLEDLSFKAMYPMRSALIDKAVQKVSGHRREVVAKFQSAIEACLQRENLHGQVSGREKHFYSIYKKMKDKKKSFNEIMDIYAFRIVVDSVDMCYRVLGAVHNLFKPVPGRFKDYIAIPKANGYQSLHTSLFGMNGIPIEIQIRTKEMDEMASYGIAAHWLYKSGSDEVNQSRVKRWVKNLLELQQRAGSSLEFVENVKTDLFPDEVYVFTPKGRIMELVKGSTAVDFAYAVHTDVGNTCIACRIDRHLAPLSQVLESGSTVEVVCSPNARPNPAWLNFVATGRARTNIRHALKQQKQLESVTLGENLLNKELASVDSYLDKIPAEQLEAVLKEYKLATPEALFEEIGLGNRVAYIVAQQLVKGLDRTSIGKKPLEIHGTEGLVITYAKCCYPIPRDPIIGHLSTGKGIVVHIENCKRVADISNTDKCVPLQWAKDIKGEFEVQLNVELEQQRGLIASLAEAVNLADANIEKIAVDERDGRTCIVNMVVTVHNRIHLSKVIKKLRLINGIIKIARTGH
ncbi:RelA/SpoT family protein [Entomomonas sp. E2T0]|uniref:RelA/SpoT family protein n=1 Tax=Entomomonas sp. E2T0 TaxID=2930213 RepID=UPI00222816DF|nr:RelA/SpoT family protein [Entomomonas sp. E2T0]UYZ85087.1 RelA/SpoT family protein [Entomomonas sp. E2T0]